MYFSGSTLSTIALPWYFGFSSSLETLFPVIRYIHGLFIIFNWLDPALLGTTENIVAFKRHCCYKNDCSRCVFWSHWVSYADHLLGMREQVHTRHAVSHGSLLGEGRKERERKSVGLWSPHLCRAPSQILPAPFISYKAQSSKLLYSLTVSKTIQDSRLREIITPGGTNCSVKSL